MFTVFIHKSLFPHSDRKVITMAKVNTWKVNKIWVERKSMDMPLRMFLSTHINKLKEGCYVIGEYYIVDVAMVLNGKVAGTGVKIMQILGTICGIKNGICSDFDVELSM